MSFLYLLVFPNIKTSPCVLNHIGVIDYLMASHEKQYFADGVFLQHVTCSHLQMHQLTDQNEATQFQLQPLTIFFLLYDHEPHSKFKVYYKFKE